MRVCRPRVGMSRVSRPTGRDTIVVEPSYAASMAPPRKSQWQTWQRFAENLVFNEAPKFIRQLQDSAGAQPTLKQGIQRGIQQGLQLGIDIIAGNASPPAAEITAGRPVTRESVPTAHRARELVYAPDLDGRADPGEIVWTWVVFEGDPTRGQDRPVLVVGRDGRTLLALMLSGGERRSADPNWVAIGSGSWDDDGRESWVRIDQVLDVPEESIRREGAILQPEVFDVVAARLRADYSWS